MARGSQWANSPSMFHKERPLGLRMWKENSLTFTSSSPAFLYPHVLSYAIQKVLVFGALLSSTNNNGVVVPGGRQVTVGNIRM